MSETDSFIQEVSEEVRQDRMFHLWKRYGPYVVGAIVVIVGAAAVWNWLEHRRAIEARETGGAFLAVEEGSIEAHQALTESVEGDASVIAEMRLAAVHADEGNRAEAVAAYRNVAERAKLSRVYTDLALLQAVTIEADSGNPATLIAELEPLVAEGAPYRALALELRGNVRLAAGEIEAAREDFEAALTEPMASGETRRRVGELIAAMGPASE